MTPILPSEKAMTSSDAAKALAELADCRAMVRDLRQIGLTNYPREVVEQLLNAIDQLVGIGESAMRGHALAQKCKSRRRRNADHRN